MRGRADFLKPGASTVSEYGPGIRKGKRKSPVALVTAVERTPVSAFSALTVAATMAPPAGSVTRPRIVLRASDWAFRRT